MKGFGMNEKILIVDDEADILEAMYLLLTEEDYRVVKALGGNEAMDRFAAEDFDLVITDLKMPHPDGSEVMRKIRETDQDTEIIVLTGYASVETAVEALRDYNAFDYMNKPLDDINEMFIVIERALERKKLRTENRDLLDRLREYNATLEKRVEERTKDLKNARVEAELAARAKSDFLACMSHELRTPLSHIIGFSEIFLADHPGDDCVENILKSGRKLLGIIDDIITFASAGSGDIHLNYGKVDLKEILKQSEMMIRDEAAKKKISFVSKTENIPECIVADEYMLRQILYNLLSNARSEEHTGGKVEISAEKVLMGTETAVEFVVRDEGIGIASENLEQIFQPFVQLENYLTRRYYGTGLGLALAKKLTELHHGSIRAESEGTGKGALFRCIIPRTPPG